MVDDGEMEQKLKSSMPTSSAGIQGIRPRDQLQPFIRANEANLGKSTSDFGKARP